MLGLVGVTDMEDRVAEVTARAVLPEIPPAVAVIVEVPVATAMARPLPLTVATAVLDELQITCVLISWLVPSEYEPMAVNRRITPRGMLGLTGVTNMEDRAPGVTERVVLPEILPEVAVMIVPPPPTAMARPLLLIVATDAFELQVTCVVISWLVPSENAPVAVNCRMTPAGRLGLPGVTDKEVKVAEVTVRVLLPEILPEVAVMMAVPAAMAVAKPPLVTVATDGLDELQVTCVVKSRLVPSEYVPTAANCGVNLKGMVRLAGVTDMEDKVAEVTVRVVLPEILPVATILIAEALMVAVPAATAAARPPLVTVATDGLDELQVTCVVRSWLVPLEYAPVALNCWVAARGITGLVGVTDMERSITAAGLLLPLLPHAVRGTAKNPRNNNPKTILIFFMSTTPGKEAARLGLPTPISVCMDFSEGNRKNDLRPWEANQRVRHSTDQRRIKLSLSFRFLTAIALSLYLQFHFSLLFCAL